MELKRLLLDHEEWLIDRVIVYAKRHEYTKYTSTLREAWRISIAGLSDAIVKAVNIYGDRVPELHPDMTFDEDPVTEFGVVEARKHRTRGITLVMFLGLFKYYTQAYLDCIERAPISTTLKNHYMLFIRRCMQRIELAYCDEWSGRTADALIEELQSKNRIATNEKNKYLTIFESVRDPIVFFDPHGRVQNMNREAVRLFSGQENPGSFYYGDKSIEGACTWLREEIDDRIGAGEANFDDSKCFFVKSVELPNGKRVMDIKVAPMLDVSDKFLGTIALVKDITELTRLATTDTLTGTHNRRHFLERAEEELKRSQRHERPLAFLMLDVDHFKKVNDSYGHGTGDRVLQTLVKGALVTLRQTDIFGRIGGEEFAALMPETERDQALHASQRLRIALGKMKTATSQGGISVTVSIGLTDQKEKAEPLEALLKRADDALYRAKRNGRNCVVQI